jgi:hypothetical protein
MTQARWRDISRAILVATLIASIRFEGRGEAGECRLLRYSFQVASRSPEAIPPGTLEMQPQIAVWLESADGIFIDTLMVTSAVALHGIANRPGSSDLPSGPRFPYGRRPMALPVWAHARGHLYPQIVMNDQDEGDLIGHEATSSPEPYFCRPLLPTEVVDAVTCPSGLFRSAKGLFAADGSTSYYPPRGDLLDVLGQPCRPLVNRPRGSCDPGDSMRFGLIDDVDAVATATPQPDRIYSGTWITSQQPAAASYAVMVEVNKEFDANGVYARPSTEGPLDSTYPDTYGQRGNLGQPSVIYRVPVTLTMGATASTTTSAGHGDPLGDLGTLFPPDSTLSTEPGSGVGRLAVIDGPSGPGRVHVKVEPCPASNCASATPVPEVAADVLPSDVEPTSAVVVIRQETADAVVDYELRYRSLPTYMPIDTGQISQWTPGPTVPSGRAGDLSRATLNGLTPGLGYVVAVRAKGECGYSMPTLVRFETPRLQFRQLSGCFIVSAAFDGDTVASLRRGRDRAVRVSGLAAAAADIYYRSAPPLADVVRRSEMARSLARGLLGPAVTVARVAVDAAIGSGGAFGESWVTPIPSGPIP